MQSHAPPPPRSHSSTRVPAKMTLIKRATNLRASDIHNNKVDHEQSLDNAQHYRRQTIPPSLAAAILNRPPSDKTQEVL